MLDSSARRLSPRSKRAVCAALAAGVALALLGACSEEKKAAPPPAPTPIARLNTDAMEVPRIEFCSLVPSAAVSAALDAEPDSDAEWGNGDEEELPGVGTDVVHEIGCSWETDDGASARAWVFARPVDAAFARTVIASGRGEPGCRTVPGPAFGQPSATQFCSQDGRSRVRHSGLFGQTWLTCELSAPDAAPAALRSRTDRWCVEIANALNTAS